MTTQRINIQPNIEANRPLRHILRKGDQIFFLHIPKTAGTSLIDILQMQVGSDEFYSFPDGLDKITPENIARTQTARIVRGHRMYDFQKYFTRRPYVITILRNPFDRVISNYAHLARAKPKQLIYIAKQGDPDRGEGPVSLEEYIRTPTTQNRLMQFLIGFMGPLRQPFEDSMMLAKVHLENLAYFGLKERFDDSVKLLTYTFGWRPIKIEAKFNIAPSESKPQLSPEMQTLLESINALDMQFYRYACDLFDHRFRQMERELSVISHETPA